jgi:hypothetical protein
VKRSSKQIMVVFAIVGVCALLYRARGCLLRNQRPIDTRVLTPRRDTGPLNYTPLPKEPSARGLKSMQPRCAESN